MKELDRVLHDTRKLAVAFSCSCEELLRNQGYLIDFSREVMGKIQDNPYNVRLFFALSKMEKSLCCQRNAINRTIICCREISDTIEHMPDNYSDIVRLRELLCEFSGLMAESGAAVDADFESMDILHWESCSLYREECLRYKEKCEYTSIKVKEALKIIA